MGDKNKNGKCGLKLSCYTDGELRKKEQNKTKIKRYNKLKKE